MPEQSTSETGHTKNVANFNRLIAAATGYGQRYNPANPRLRTAALRAQHAAAEAAVKAVADALPAFKTAQNDRDTLYAPLEALATRIMGAVVAAEAGQRAEDDVRTLVRKIRGERATPEQPATPDDPSTPDVDESSGGSISASQQSFDNKAAHLYSLVRLLRGIQAYDPNEADLSTEALTTLQESLEAANEAVDAAFQPVAQARLRRNMALYAATTGIVGTAKRVKGYVRSVFGAASSEYGLISGLEFRVVKN